MGKINIELDVDFVSMINPYAINVAQLAYGVEKNEVPDKFASIVVGNLHETLKRFRNVDMSKVTLTLTVEEEWMLTDTGVATDEDGQPIEEVSKHPLEPLNKAELDSLIATEPPELTDDGDLMVHNEEVGEFEEAGEAEEAEAEGVIDADSEPEVDPSDAN